MNDRYLKPTAIIAHRGKHDSAPENSMRALEDAIACGADALELDVHATRDGVVVVYHDLAVHLPQGPVAIASLTWSDVESFQLDDRSHLPRLSDVLSLAAGKVHVHVEIKARGIEREVLTAISGSHASASVHSFDHRTIARCAQLQGKVRRGILLESYLIDNIGAMRNASAHDLWQRYELIDEQLIADVHGAGGAIIAWTVNDAGDAFDLAHMGVNGICTDDIIGIREALRAA